MTSSSAGWLNCRDGSDISVSITDYITLRPSQTGHAMYCKCKVENRHCNYNITRDDLMLLHELALFVLPGDTEILVNEFTE